MHFTLWNAIFNYITSSFLGVEIAVRVFLWTFGYKLQILNKLLYPLNEKFCRKRFLLENLNTKKGIFLFYELLPKIKNYCQV